MLLFILPYALQIGLIIHAIKTGKNTTWIWLLIMLPVVGGVVYLIMEVLPDLRRGRLVDPTSILRLVDKNHVVRRLKERILVSDTVATNLELAEEYYRMGAFAQARDQFRSQLTGVYRDHVSIRLNVEKSAFFADDYETADEYFQLSDSQSAIKATDLLAYKAFSHFMVAPSLERLGVLENLFLVTKNCEVGLYLCRAFGAMGEKHRIPKVVELMRIQAKNASGSYRAAMNRSIQSAERIQSLP